MRYLAAGHLSVDLAGDERRLGGTVLFAAAVAARLGHEAEVVTACSEETAGAARDLLGLPVRNVAPGEDTVFRFDRGFGHGPTSLASRARPVPVLEEDADVLHLGPIAGEISAGWRARFTGLTAQGLLREFGPDGEIRHRPAPLPAADAIVVADVEFPSLEPRGLVLVTRGEHGADAYLDGTSVSRAAPDAAHDAPDTVGAGDVFAAIAFCALAGGDDVAASLRRAVDGAAAYVGAGAGLQAVRSI
jgi:hypothetical protein